MAFSGAGATVVGRHYPELDGLRAVAVAAVIVFHCRKIATPDTPWQDLYLNLADTGWVGVDLFFVISGFLITGILLDTKNQADYFKNFYIRRSLRIFPLYYTSIVLIPVAFHILAVDRPTDVLSWPYWLYLQNWIPLFEMPMTQGLGHLWSLAVEEQFYLIWPALILFAARRNSVGRMCMALLLLTVVFRVLLVLSGHPRGAYFATISRLDPLVVGACLAVLLRHRGTLEVFRSAATWTIAVTGLVIALVAFLGRGFFGHTVAVVLLGFFPLALCFGGVFVLALTARPEGGFRLLLRSRPLRFVGKISYGVYVFHLPLVFLLKSAWPTGGEGFWLSQFSFLTVVTATSVFLAWLSYQHFEKPILDLKDQLAPIAPSQLRDDSPAQEKVRVHKQEVAWEFGPSR